MADTVNDFQTLIEQMLQDIRELKNKVALLERG